PPRLPQPHGRRNLGAADERPAAEPLLRQRAPRRDGDRLARLLWRLLRHHRRPGLLLSRFRPALDRHRRPPASRPLPRGPNAAMIRVVLPAHLKTLARVTSEVELDVPAPVTQRSILDAVEARFPMLGGTIRDYKTKERRPMIRFFACEE